jgi:orotidine-5'-phosphate decarboxylase
VVRKDFGTDTGGSRWRSNFLWSKKRPVSPERQNTVILSAAKNLLGAYKILRCAQNDKTAKIRYCTHAHGLAKRPNLCNNRSHTTHDRKECLVLPFADRLAEAVRRRGNPVLVGLDPRADSLPPGFLDDANRQDLMKTAAAFGRFCREIIDVVAPLVPAVKPQSAFFEQLGPTGMTVLAELIDHATQQGLLVILDGKRNDIGSTAAAYAEGMLGSAGQSPWGADALTVSPYLGEDSLHPFVETAERRAAGIFVLVKTSNPGGGMFQDLLADGKPVYRHVADYVEARAARTAAACGYGVVGAVVGATYPEQLAELRAAMPHAWFLVPGFGSQGGTARDTAAAFHAGGLGAVVNNSRGIIFAYRNKTYDRFGAARWQEAVAAATRDMIDQLRADTPAGELIPPVPSPTGRGRG